MLVAIDYVTLWLRAVVARAVGTAKRIWEVGSFTEVFSVFWLALCSVNGGLAVTTGEGGWTGLVVPLIALWVFLDLLNDTAHLRLSLWALRRQQPSGAPSAVVVDCSLADGQHRLAYTGGSWQEIK